MMMLIELWSRRDPTPNSYIPPNIKQTFGYFPVHKRDKCHVETIVGSLIPLLQYYVQFPPLLPHSIYVIGVGLNPANDEY